MTAEDTMIIHVAIVLLVSGVAGFVIGTVVLKAHDHFTKGEKK